MTPTAQFGTETWAAVFEAFARPACFGDTLVKLSVEQHAPGYVRYPYRDRITAGWESLGDWIYLQGDPDFEEVLARGGVRPPKLIAHLPQEQWRWGMTYMLHLRCDNRWSPEGVPETTLSLWNPDPAEFGWSPPESLLQSDADARVVASWRLDMGYWAGQGAKDGRLPDVALQWLRGRIREKAFEAKAPYLEASR